MMLYAGSDPLDTAQRALRSWYPMYRSGFLHTDRGALPINIYFCKICTLYDRPIPSIQVTCPCLVALFYLYKNMIIPCKRRWLIPSRYWHIPALGTPYPVTQRPYNPVDDGDPVNYSWKIGW